MSKYKEQTTTGKTEMTNADSTVEWDAVTIQHQVDPGKTPTPEQIAVIEGPLRPTLVVAGAGSGKTETMSMRVLWLVAHEKINPERILGLTFSRKAAGELGERLRERLAALSHAIDEITTFDDPVVTTYNGFAQRIVIEHGWRVGFSSDTRLLSAGAAVQLLSDIVRQHPIEELPDGSLDTLVKDCKNLAQRLSEHGYTVESARKAIKELSIDIENQATDAKGKIPSKGQEILRILEKREGYLALVDEFARRKKQLGVIDFSDQLSIANRLVKEFPEVRDTIRAEYDAILLDEFQDTSVIQMELFSTIFGTIDKSTLAVTAVGDPQQAIYGWRGASAASLDNFIRYFDCAGQNLTDEQVALKSRQQTLSLSTAWRNDRQILAAANVLAAPLQQRNRNMDVQPLKARDQAECGRVVMNYLLTPEQEATYIADEYAAIIASWEQACLEAKIHLVEPPKRPSMAVLMSKRKYFPLVESALRSRGLPVQSFGSAKLLDQPLVRRLRTALIACSDIADGAAIVTLIDSLRLGASDMALLWQWAQEKGKTSSSPRAHDAILLDAIDSPPHVGWQADPSGPAFTREAFERVNVLSRRLRAIRQVTNQGLVELVEFAIGELGLIEEALADRSNGDGRAALDTFMDVVNSYVDENEWAELHGFLSWLTVSEEENTALPAPLQVAQEGAVHLMTVHASKGLEWDVVSVIALGDGAFPGHASKSEMRKLIHKGDHFEHDPGHMWGTNGWLGSAQEIPYDLRGDRDALPVFDFGQVEALVRPSGKPWSFTQYVGEFYKIEVARHLEAEQRRLAYVAVTRARHTLFLTGRWHEGNAKARFPSVYWLEVLRSLILQGEESSHASADSWAAHSSLDERSEMLDQWREAEKSVADPEAAFARASELAHSVDRVLVYPAPSTPFQARCEEAGKKIRAEVGEMAQDSDVVAILEDLSDDEMIRHAIAVIAEKRQNCQGRSLSMEVSELRATAVASLIEDAQGFAVNMRRPLPAQPSASASLGTLIHAWVERQLRQVTGELWTEEIEGAELLTVEEQQRLEKMQENFLAWNAPGQVIAVEELFAVRVADVNIQGRIDAVFRDDAGDIVVDWKSGRLPDPHNIAKLRYFRDQLCLYQLAWAQRSEVEAEQVRAQLFFLEHGRVITLEQIDQWLNEAGVHADLVRELALILSDDD